MTNPTEAVARAILHRTILDGIDVCSSPEDSIPERNAIMFATDVIAALSEAGLVIVPRELTCEMFEAVFNAYALSDKSYPEMFREMHKSRYCETA